MQRTARHAASRPGAMRQRATYHHGNLRAALIAGASALLESEGPLGVTLRGAARQAGVSQAAPYRHFPNKSALLAAVAEAGFQTMTRTISRAAERQRNDPVQALEAMARVIVRFAAEHPSRYRLMCGPAVRGRDHPALREAATTTWQLLTAAIRECQRVGRMRAGDPERLGFVFWALVHGVAVLVVDEQLPLPVLHAHSIEDLAGYAIRALLAGLGTQRGG